jgi:hypothetical protein
MSEPLLILMKSGMKVMPLEATPTLYLLFPTIRNNNMTDARTCEVGVTLVLFDRIIPE